MLSALRGFFGVQFLYRQNARVSTFYTGKMQLCKPRLTHWVLSPLSSKLDSAIVKAGQGLDRRPSKLDSGNVKCTPAADLRGLFGG